MIKEIKFRAWDVNHEEMVYIEDLYWFEENGVHDGSGKGHYANYELMLYIGFHDRYGRDIYDGDVLKVFVKRESSSYSSWCKETNINHGSTGDYVYVVVDRCVAKNKFNWFSGFKTKDLPITKKQVEEIEKPRGRERHRQIADYWNYDIEDCEVVGNIYENPEFLTL